MTESKIFLALDKDNKSEILQLAEKTSRFNFAYKIGPRLSLKYGESIIKELAEYGPVFVDNKYYDIPNTMLASVRSTFESGASYCTVHAQCGPEALTALAKLELELNKVREFKILAVTILTSFSSENLPVTQISSAICEQVVMLAEQAYKCGIKNFVCSAKEVATLRETYADAFLVTPGIRFQDEDSADQKRVVEPSQAFKSGASAIVVGRPICNAEDPVLAAQKYAASINT